MVLMCLVLRRWLRRLLLRLLSLCLRRLHLLWLLRRDNLLRHHRWLVRRVLRLGYVLLRMCLRRQMHQRFATWWQRGTPLRAGLLLSIHVAMRRQRGQWLLRRETGPAS